MCMSLFNLDIESLIKTVGMIGVIAIVFAESGLLIGFFLPGDSLLFVAGFLASQHYMNIHTLVLLVAIAAISGDSTGYYFGRRLGRKLFKKNNRFIKQEYLEKTEAFYEKHGGKTIILARFVPIVRTFAPFVAGASKMDYKKFLSFNIFGGLLWGAGITYLGYFLGNSIPNIDSYLMPVTILIIILSFAPGIIHYLSKKENRTRITDIVKNFYLKLKP